MKHLNIYIYIYVDINIYTQTYRYQNKEKDITCDYIFAITKRDYSSSRKTNRKSGLLQVSILLGKFPTHVYKINEKHLFSTDINQRSTSLILEMALTLLTTNIYSNVNFIKQS